MPINLLIKPSSALSLKPYIPSFGSSDYWVYANILRHGSHTHRQTDVAHGINKQFGQTVASF